MGEPGRLRGPNLPPEGIKSSSMPTGIHLSLIHCGLILTLWLETEGGIAGARTSRRIEMDPA